MRKLENANADFENARGTKARETTCRPVMAHSDR